MLEKLKARLAELMKITEQSATQHNSIVGRVNEIQEWIKHLEDEEAKVAGDVQEEIKEVESEIV